MTRMALVDIRYNIRGRKGQRLFFGYAYTKGSQPPRIVVNLRPHWLKMRRLHRGYDWFVQELIGTIDHEISHMFSPLVTAHKGDEESYIQIFDETLARGFEREGSRVRCGSRRGCGLYLLRI